MTLLYTIYAISKELFFIAASLVALLTFSLHGSRIGAMLIKNITGKTPLEWLRIPKQHRWLAQVLGFVLAGAVVIWPLYNYIRSKNISPSITESRPVPPPSPCALQSNLDKAINGGIESLRRFVVECQSGGGELIDGAKAALEDAEYQRALTCFDVLATSSVCTAESFNICLGVYVAALPGGGRLGELRAKVQAERKSVRCRPPPQQQQQPELLPSAKSVDTQEVARRTPAVSALLPSARKPRVGTKEVQKRQPPAVSAPSSSVKKQQEPRGSGIKELAVLGGQSVFRSEPPGGTVSSGSRVIVNDGSCGSGKIKVIIGGDDRRGIPRQRYCIAR